MKKTRALGGRLNEDVGTLAGVPEPQEINLVSSVLCPCWELASSFVLECISLLYLLLLPLLLLFVRALVVSAGVQVPRSPTTSENLCDSTA